MVRSIARTVRHLPDRLLHPLRRRRALERLRERGVKGTVHFICLGNINRSAYAAVAFRRAMASRGRDTVRVASAGFIGPGRPSPDLAQAEAERRGLDLTQHVSRLLIAGDVGEDDLLVVMTVEQRRRARRLLDRPSQDVVVLGDLDPVPIVRRLVQDPYGHPAHVFEGVFDRIDRCVEQLASAMARD